MNFTSPLNEVKTLFFTLGSLPLLENAEKIKKGRLSRIARL
jgi:hypothetical protein